MRKQNTNGILMISYYFPPTKAIGTIRNYSIAQEFEKYFDFVHVISTSNASFLPNQELPYTNTFQVEQARTIDFRQLIYWFSKQSENLYKKNPPGTFTKKLIRLKNTFPFNLVLDEGGLVYIFNAYQKAVKLIEKEQIQYIYSSYRPYADHFVAWLLKQRFPELKWIADFRDPYVDLNYPSSFWPKWQRAFNKYILKKADLITTVSEGLAKHFKYYKRPVYVLRNGINHAIQEMAIPQLKVDKFTISYTGSIYLERQTPRPLFVALQSLLAQKIISPKSFALVYAGKDKAVWDQWISHYGLEAISHSEGQQPLQRSIALQHSSHMNLLMSWSGPNIQGILTGKLYEYLIAKKPIISVIKGQKDPELEAIFEQVNAGKITYADDNNSALANFIQDQYLKWLTDNQATWQFNESALNEFEWGFQMEQFAKYLRKERIITNSLYSLAK